VIGPLGRRLGRTGCAAAGEAWDCLVTVPPGAREVTFVLEGGSPFEIQEIRLRTSVQPSGLPGSPKN
jgi:hypothetical protein